MSDKDKTTKPSEPAKVDAYMKALDHPLKNVLEELRKIIVGVDKEIGEEIKWNAPTFFYAGLMKHTDPKEYKRYLVVSTIYPKDMIRLVFPSGNTIEDVAKGTDFLTGAYADGRRIATFLSMDDVKANKALLQKLIKVWLQRLEK